MINKKPNTKEKTKTKTKTKAKKKKTRKLSKAFKTESFNLDLGPPLRILKDRRPDLGSRGWKECFWRFWKFFGNFPNFGHRKR